MNSFKNIVLENNSKNDSIKTMEIKRVTSLVRTPSNDSGIYPRDSLFTTKKGIVEMYATKKQKGVVSDDQNFSFSSAVQPPKKLSYCNIKSKGYCFFLSLGSKVSASFWSLMENPEEILNVQLFPFAYITSLESVKNKNLWTNSQKLFKKD